MLVKSALSWLNSSAGGTPSTRIGVTASAGGAKGPDGQLKVLPGPLLSPLLSPPALFGPALVALPQPTTINKLVKLSQTVFMLSSRLPPAAADLGS